MICGFKLHNGAEGLAGKLLSHPLLADKFTCPVNPYTGELKSNSLVAKDRHLEIEIIDNKNVIFRGSLHKFFTNGFNHNNFYLQDVRKAIDLFADRYDIEPKQCFLETLEYAANIKPPIPTSELIQSLVCFDNKPFNEWSYRNGVPLGLETRGTNYVMKIYNKALLSYIQNQDILRYEIKAKKMAHLQPMGIKTLDCLTDKSKLEMLGLELIKSVNKLTVFDESIDINTVTASFDREVLMQGSNPKYWQDTHLTRAGRLNRKKLFENLVRQKSGRDIKAALADAIEYKTSLLFST